MSTKNGTNGVANGNGVEVKSDEAPRVFSTLEEALANPRHGKDKDGNVKEWSVFRCAAPDGKEYFIWTGSGGVGLTQVVQSLGWTVGLAQSKGRAKVDVKALLTSMSDEERTALLAAFLKKGKKSKKQEATAE